MTTEYPYSLAQLAQILSALENERRNPNTKRNAIKAIERAAREIGLTAADGLLSGRMDAAAFRAALRDEGCESATFVTEPPAEPAADGAANNDEPREADFAGLYRPAAAGAWIAPRCCISAIVSKPRPSKRTFTTRP